MTLTATLARVKKLERVYDTSDREEAAARIRRMCAAHPALIPHTERIVAALLSRGRAYSFVVPEGAVGVAEVGPPDAPPLEEEHLITWRNYPHHGPIIWRFYLHGGRSPQPTVPEPSEPEPEQQSPAPDLSAYDRLMAHVTQQENGASEE